MGSDGKTPLYLQPVPWQSEAFYSTLFSRGLRQGMFATELDYQSSDYALLKPLRTNVTWASDWLRGLSSAAERLGVPVQWCMSLPRFVLQVCSRSSSDSVRSVQHIATRLRSLTFLSDSSGAGTACSDQWTGLS